MPIVLLSMPSERFDTGSAADASGSVDIPEETLERDEAYMLALLI